MPVTVTEKCQIELIKLRIDIQITVSPLSSICVWSPPLSLICVWSLPLSLICVWSLPLSSICVWSFPSLFRIRSSKTAALLQVRSSKLVAKNQVFKLSLVFVDNLLVGSGSSSPNVTSPDWGSSIVVLGQQKHKWV